LKIYVVGEAYGTLSLQEVKNFEFFLLEIRNRGCCG